MRILISSNKFPKVFTNALGLARIPKFNVEEITEVAMVERLMMMETKMTTMDEMVDFWEDTFPLERYKLNKYELCVL